MSLFTSIALIVSLLLTSNRKSSRYFPIGDVVGVAPLIHVLFDLNFRNRSRAMTGKVKS